MRPQKLKLGFSPCPNDTFMFDAMVHHKIDTEGLEFNLTICDVEELNHLALNNALDVSKVSFHAYLYLLKNYILLESGSAMGENVGPLFIAKTLDIKQDAVVAIPGIYTTANLLLSLCYPEIKQKQEILFSDIEQAVLDERVDAGVIIHENRFTYHEKGLVKIADLGEVWTRKTGQLIPLGGIVAQNTLPQDVIEKLNRVLHKSIEYAFANPESSASFIKEHAQNMSPEITRKHIELYVTPYSLELGEKGRKAIEVLCNEASKLGMG